MKAKNQLDAAPTLPPTSLILFGRTSPEIKITFVVKYKTQGTAFPVKSRLIWTGYFQSSVVNVPMMKKK